MRRVTLAVRYVESPAKGFDPVLAEERGSAVLQEGGHAGLSSRQGETGAPIRGSRRPDILLLAMAGRAHEMIESSDAVRIALHDLGGPSGTTTPVLLFSHATGLHGRVWEPMASFLSDRFRCVSLDLRGHGMSELPPGAGLAWSGMVDDIRAALDSDHLPVGPLHGVGHSMGGAALVLAAAARPDAFRSLWMYEPVIVPPEDRPLFDGDNPMSEAAIRRRNEFDSLDQAYENYRSKPPLDQLHPEALRAYVDGGFARTPDGSVTLRCRPSTEAEVFRRPRPAVRGTPSIHWRYRWPSWSDVPRTSGPEAFAPEIAAALLRGTLVERPHLGHFGPLEDPAAMAADVADWVRRNSSRVT